MIHGTNLLIRSDVSPTTGLLHLGRSLKIGRGWKKLGGSVTLVCGDLPPRLERQLQNERFRTWTLAHPDCGLIDAKQTKEIAQRVAANWVLVDGPRFNQRYRDQLIDPNWQLAAMIDSPAADSTPDTTFISGHTPTSLSHPNILSGDRYRVQSTEFEQRNLQTTTAREARRLLVWLNSETCPERVTRILESLIAVARPRTSVDVVIPQVQENSDHWVELKKSTPAHIRFHRSAYRVLNSAAAIDLAVTDHGTHNQALAANGIPVASLECDHLQFPGQPSEQMSPAILSVPSPFNGQTSAFKTALRKLIRDRSQRESMSDAGRNSFDRQAPHRICRHLMLQEMTINHAKATDWQAIWAWQRDAETRSVAFDSLGKDERTFRNTFIDSLRDDCSTRLLAKDQDQRAIGQIMVSTRNSPGDANVQVLVHPGFRNRGMGTALLEQTIDQLYRFSTIDQISLRAKAGNYAAEQLATNAGLSQTNPTIINNQLVHQFVITRQQFLGNAVPAAVEIRRSA